MSAHEKLTVTGLLFQPAAFAAGNAALVMVGAVRSIETTVLPVAQLFDGSHD